MLEPSRTRLPLGDTDSIASWTRELVREFVAEDRRPAFLRGLSIPAEYLWRPEGRLPHSSICAVGSQLTDKHAEPVFGLSFVARQDVSTLGVTGYLAMACTTCCSRPRTTATTRPGRVWPRPASGRRRARCSTWPCSSGR